MKYEEIGLLPSVATFIFLFVYGIMLIFNSIKEDILPPMLLGFIMIIIGFLIIGEAIAIRNGINGDKK